MRAHTHIHTLRAYIHIPKYTLVHKHSREEEGFRLQGETTSEWEAKLALLFGNATAMDGRATVNGKTTVYGHATANNSHSELYQTRQTRDMLRSEANLGQSNRNIAVCMYVCMYVCIRVCVCVCVCEYLFMSAYACMYVCVYV